MRYSVEGKLTEFGVWPETYSFPQCERHDRLSRACLGAEPHSGYLIAVLRGGLSADSTLLLCSVLPSARRVGMGSAGHTDQ